MADRLVFDPSLDVLSHPGEGLVLRTVLGDQVLDDPVFAAVAAGVELGLDEDDLADHIVASLPDTDLVDAYHGIEFLRSRGYLRAEPVAGYAFAAGIHPPGAPAARDPATVALVDEVGRPDLLDPLAAALTAAGHRVAGGADAAPAGADLVVVLVAGDAAERIDELAADPEGPAVLPLTVARKRLLLGPRHGPRSPRACRRCLEHWLRANEQLPPAAGAGSTAGSTTGPGPLVATTTAHLFAVELVRLLGADLDETPLDDVVVSYEPTTQSVVRHHVLPAPGCRRCLPASGRHDLSGSLRAGPTSPVRVVSTDGGSRTETPAETLRRLERYSSTVCGILPPPVPASDHPVIHSFAVGMNAAFPRRTLDERRFGVRSMSGGKGRTREQAQVSALCEGIERYAGIFQGTEPVVRRAFDDFDGDAIDPATVQLFSERQYERRAQTYDPADPFNVVPLPFDRRATISWTALEPVRAGPRRWLPTSQVYYSFLDNPAGGANSNGVAAGATATEARLHGLHELVERDAVAIWWYNRLRVPAFDLEGADDPALARIVDAHDRLGRDLWVLDVTTDVGMPAAAAVSARREAPHHIVLGFGAHTSAHVAVLRAVTEVNQFLPSVVDLTTGQARLASPSSAGGRWQAHATLDDNPYLRPRGVVPVDRREPAGASVADQLEWCLHAVEAVGVEVYSVRLTRPEAPLEVYRMVAPGLRHFWARFAPGRLYDEPVRTGRLGSATREEDLNPVAMFV